MTTNKREDSVPNENGEASSSDSSEHRWAVYICVLLQNIISFLYIYGILFYMC
jgi:hypothetical protein